jgi:hypothetical protein
MVEDKSNQYPYDYSNESTLIFKDHAHVWIKLSKQQKHLRSVVVTHAQG